MSSTKAGSVLAIGIDAAEQTIVRRLIEQNQMPALASLLADGEWLRVNSPAPIGSGAVWPTFMSGVDPNTHGIYSEWRWHPESMSLQRYNGNHLTPFWKSLADRGIKVGVLDVPFAYPIGLTEGFEVCEWWSHDSMGTGLQMGPRKIEPLVNASPPHPVLTNRFVNANPADQERLKNLSAACVAGATLRGNLARELLKETAPQLSLIVFPEIHHSSHQLFHTVMPSHRVYHDLIPEAGNGVASLLKNVYREVDRQIGKLIETAGEQTTIMVFALHGMRPAVGFPAFLGPALREFGFEHLKGWSSQSWRERLLALAAKTKRRTPVFIKKIYYDVMPINTTHQLARPTMLPVYDWSKTRAFSLPTDQYGWIRINLKGREKDGCVPLDQYEATCAELEELLRGLVNEAGRPLTEDVIRTVAGSEAALSNPLPDLIAHWTYDAFADPVRVKGTSVAAEPISKKSTGQHASEGFCIFKGAHPGNVGEVVAAKDLGRLMMSAL